MVFAVVAVDAHFLHQHQLGAGHNTLFENRNHSDISFFAHLGNRARHHLVDRYVFDPHGFALEGVVDHHLAGFDGFTDSDPAGFHPLAGHLKPFLHDWNHQTTGIAHGVGEQPGAGTLPAEICQGKGDLGAIAPAQQQGFDAVVDAALQERVGLAVFTDDYEIVVGLRTVRSGQGGTPGAGGGGG